MGEGTEAVHSVVQFTAPLLPADKPRYLMGVGYERDIVLSFFIVMPAMPVVGALATWLGRKR